MNREEKSFAFILHVQSDTTLPEINDKSAWETEKEAQLVKEHTKGPARMCRAPTYLKDYIT